MMNPHSRRSFIKNLALAAAALPFAGIFGRSLAFAKDVAPPTGQNPIAESDAVANAIGYKHNVKDIDFGRYPNRKKPEAKNQSCKNCALYTPSNEGWGKCQMLTNGLVSANGWCGSWNKKS